MYITHKIITTALFILLVFSLSSCSTPDGDVAEGKRWYSLHNCSACHGDAGNNGDAISIAPLDMSFYSFKKRLRKEDGQIMPYFPKDELNNDDAADIYVFLKNSN